MVWTARCAAQARTRRVPEKVPVRAPPWFLAALSQLVRERDGEDPWPATVARLGCSGETDEAAAQLRSALAAALADAVATATIPPSVFAAVTGMTNPGAGVERVDQQLRCLWYDLWGRMAIPGADEDVPWFLPGYTSTSYMVYLEWWSLKNPLSAAQQAWLDARGLVRIELPDELTVPRPGGRRARSRYVDPAVLDDAVARVRLGWLTRK